jgi:hypothetical protein
LKVRYDFSNISGLVLELKKLVRASWIVLRKNLLFLNQTFGLRLKFIKGLVIGSVHQNQEPQQEPHDNAALAAASLSSF